jgi:RHH-type proline utilization regulon transcriptional repressor/proline dehydrogenase/delta 1-pyrroline-5-carboxylate dehydrogenase
MSNDLEENIISFGKEIFSSISGFTPSSFSKNFWIRKVMEYSMTMPEIKLNLFRLVDVLPSLKSVDAVAEHVNAYLSQAAHLIHPSLGWALSVEPGTIRGKTAGLMVRRSVKELSQIFIAGDGPKDALKQLKRLRGEKIAYTVDLLGEFCLSEEEAETYLKRYLEVIEVLGSEAPKWKESATIVAGHPCDTSPSCISIKLTALYSQTNILNFSTSVKILSERLSEIVSAAKRRDISIYVDAEDSANNPIIYQVFKEVFGTKPFKDIKYPGIVVQAYAKNCESIIHDLISFAKIRGVPIAVRLVKGAYWDYETISATQNGLPSPLFAYKESSDANYERLSRLLLDNYQDCLPAFASHNIRSLSHAICYARSRSITEKDFEIQTLYGMAEPIARAYSERGFLVRAYVPLGDLFVGMGYLVRRLLENTSNESFLKHTFFDEREVAQLLRAPQFNPADLSNQERIRQTV